MTSYLHIIFDLTEWAIWSVLSANFVELKFYNIAISDDATWDNIAKIAPGELVVMIVNLTSRNVEDFYFFADIATKDGKALIV